MTGLVLALVALLGICVGSFLNVVVYRVPRGESVVRPGSHCPSCGHPVRGRDNIPVISYLLLRGKCRDCAEPISPRYMLVELGCGALFTVSAWRLGLTAALPAYLYLCAAGLALALIDWQTHRLPDAITKPSYVVAALLLTVGAVAAHDGAALLRAAIGGAIYAAVYLALFAVRPGAMGWGDVKLSGLLGMYTGFLGWGELALGLLAGFLAGGVIAAVLLATGGARRGSRVAFGPAMISGVAIAVLGGAPLVHLWLHA